ncbi:MAG: dihydroorotate dehydrogenase [Mycoplasmatales bacterium]
MNIKQKIEKIVVNQARLNVEIAGLNLKNIVMPASGCCSFGQELAEIYDLSVLGAIVVKSTTNEEYLGNPPHRIFEVEAGMLNAIGLQNPGVETVVNEYLPALAKYDTHVIVNVAGSDEESYLKCVEALNKSAYISALELNVSCPNVKAGGIHFGTDENYLFELVQKVKQLAKFPVFVKLTPNVTDVKKLAIAAEKAGADGITMINTLVGMAIDYKTGRPILANKIGGFSGPAIKPVALKQVYEVSQVVTIPIIGIGGIQSATDIIEFLSVGASAVQIGTANFNNPLVCIDVLVDLLDLMDELGVEHVTEFKNRAFNN